MSIYSNTGLDEKIVGRSESFFAHDLINLNGELKDAIANSRILIIGGAGSIGSNTLTTILHFRPSEICVIDSNENGLAELVRMIRSSSMDMNGISLVTLPFDYGAKPFELWIKSRVQDFDYVLNFAALKHVRSEKDPYSILSMLDTNVMKLVRLNRLLRTTKAPRREFCVSTDKAANPSSMMGATKRLMEHALFNDAVGLSNSEVISARFANVAFSNGSLLQSWLNRFSQRQPLACPEECRRYFVSLPESGHLCTLAAFLGSNKDIFVPKLNAEEHLVRLQDVVSWYLEEQGYQAKYFHSEEEAKRELEALSNSRQWPVVLTPLDTAGEKPYEEFIAEGEKASPTSLSSLDAVGYMPPKVDGSFEAFLDWLETVLTTSEYEKISIELLREKISSVEASFLETHRASAKSLDQRI